MKRLPQQQTTNWRCAAFQMSEDLDHAVAKA
jgi:hypothetical protein